MGGIWDLSTVSGGGMRAWRGFARAAGKGFLRLGPPLDPFDDGSGGHVLVEAGERRAERLDLALEGDGLARHVVGGERGSEEQGRGLHDGFSLGRVRLVRGASDTVAGRFRLRRACGNAE